ncbi:CPBP family intramembrane glutamic endopeptidase [Paenibacillus nanensis]|uniref:CPBP family intramembrane glutamic endopeptidase n=1 Tax=Paenibacillus nanensis TaxID=393251 RepID=UPI0013C3224E|nr:CPBP family intramembrane glutamic endopeptidase [Paenibacillus nanensis]
MFAREGEFTWIWWGGAFIAASIILLLVKWANRRGLSEVYVELKGWRKRTIIYLFLLGLVSYGAVFAIRLGLGGIQFIGMPPFMQVGAAIAECILMTFYIALTEEVIFRGFVLSNLLRKYSAATAVAGSLVLFILFHLPKWESLVTSPYLFHLAASGFLFSIVCIRSKTLWHSIALHWGWNMGAFMLIEHTDTVVWTEQPSSFGWSNVAGWASVFVNLILICLVFKLYKTARRSGSSLISHPSS